MAETTAAMDDTRSSVIDEYFASASQVLGAVATGCADSILEAADVIAAALEQGGKLLICGNGGSAADAQHMAAEFVSSLRHDQPRGALPALALTTNTSFLTAYGNDESFDGIFMRQVEAHGKKGDVLLGITTSGSSKNVLNAFAAADKMKMHTIGLTGSKGSQMPAKCVIAVPSDDTQHIQEAHIAIEHMICSLVENRLFPNMHDR